MTLSTQHRRSAVRHVSVLAGLLVVMLLFASWLEPGFTQAATQIELAGHAWELALLAIPATLIIISGGIDLSVGSTMALCAVVLGLSVEAGLGPPAAVGLTLLTGLAAGAVNGLCVARLGVHPLIITLATLSAYRGIAEGVSLGRPISGFPPGLLSISARTLLGVPLPGVVVMAAALAAWVLLGCSAAGRRVYAMGLNEAASRYSGIDVGRAKVALYSLSGMAAAAAAICFVARRNTAKADVGAGMELDVITAVVLGGVRIDGGRGGIVGAMLGAALIHEMREFISWRWNHDELTPIVVGALLIGSVLLSRASGDRTI